MTDVAAFLQQNYEKALASGAAKKSVGFAPNNSSSGNLMALASPSAKSASVSALTNGVNTGNSVSSTGSSNANNMVVDMANWESHIDPDSGGKYYIHIKTGECLWENELKQRVAAYQKPSSSGCTMLSFNR